MVVINIRTPKHKIRSTYVNRHDDISVTLQGICDANKKFIDCFTGLSSKIHDSRIFKESFIRERVEKLGPDYHILGNLAYGLSQNVLTPYRGENLTQEQTAFNRRFSKARVKIENAFADLKGRFRQLVRVDLWSVLKISKFIICCCVLHNLCIENDDFLIENYEQPEHLEDADHENNEEPHRTVAEAKRDRIAAGLYAR